MAAPIPLDDLDAVNAMLHDIGDRPVNTLTDASRLDVVRAINALDGVSRTVQQRGWWFNSEQIIVQIDSNGHYNLTDDIVGVSVIDGGPVATNDQYPFKLVQRGTKLYDRSNAIDVFDTNSENIVLSVIRLLDYSDLPSTAREYIYCAASIRFQSRTLGSTAVDADLREQARTALTNLQEEDLDFEAIEQPKTDHFFNLMYNR